MKEVERRGGDLISFYEPLVVVAYYMIIMKEVALKGEVERMDTFFFFLFYEPVVVVENDSYVGGGEGRWRLYFFCEPVVVVA